MPSVTKTVTNEVNMLTESVIKKHLKMGVYAQLSDGNARGTGRLVLRIKGTDATWYAQQWVDDKRRLTKIGVYPELTLASARVEFSTRFQPKIIAKEDIRTAPPIGTVKALFDDYVAHLKAKDKRSAEDVEYTLARMAVRIGENQLANRVTSKDIVEAIRPTYDSGCASMADHMRGYIRSAYGWAIRSQNDYRSKASEKFKLTTNPAYNIPTEPKVAGERWLSVDELRAFWRWNGTTNINRNTDPRNYIAMKFLCMTGQRSEEIARLHASMINRRMNLIEWSKTKNGKAHVLPITATVLDVLDRAVPNEHGFLFPSEVFPERHITDQTIRLVCARYCANTKANHFSPRDLRRTWKTLSGQAGISKEDRDRLQNHSKSDVSSVHYDRYDYLKEKRQAMEAWMSWFEKNIIQ